MMRWTQKFGILILTTLLFSKVWAIRLENDIVTFSDEDEAAAFVFSSMWNYVPPESQPKTYEKSDEIVNRLWPFFCKRYPDCEKRPKPEIIFSYSPGSGSFGMGYQGELKQTNAIILSFELFDNYKDLEFVIAHEMVHYFENHTETQGLREEISSIRRQSFDHCLDYPWPLEDLKDDLINLIDVMDHLGEKPHLVDYQLGLPIDGELGKILARMIEKSKDGPGCASLTAKLNVFRERVARGGYLYRNEKGISSFMKQASECFQKFEGNLLKESVDSLGIDLSGNDPRNWSEIDGLLGNDGEELERLIRIRNTLYQSYVALSRKLSAPQLRYQTEEDIADIHALNILLESGRRNMEDYVDYLLIDLPGKDAIRCRADLERGVEPSYGALNREHHGECWRIWRAKKVEERFLRNTPE